MRLAVGKDLLHGQVGRESGIVAQSRGGKVFKVDNNQVDHVLDELGELDLHGAIVNVARRRHQDPLDRLAELDIRADLPIPIVHKLCADQLNESAQLLVDLVRRRDGVGLALGGGRRGRCCQAAGDARLGGGRAEQPRRKERAKAVLVDEEPATKEASKEDRECHLKRDH